MKQTNESKCGIKRCARGGGGARRPEENLRIKCLYEYLSSVSLLLLGVWNRSLQLLPSEVSVVFFPLQILSVCIKLLLILIQTIKVCVF